ncbi:hypothetical protein LCGC14_2810120, partial [marine sediment metagenome]
QMGGKQAEYTLIHSVETPGALLYGKDIKDLETESDTHVLETFKQELENQGYTIEVALGFGSPKKSIPQLINKGEFDLLVLGGHGHTLFKDLLLGTTVDSVRHNVDIPVFIA